LIFRELYDSNIVAVRLLDFKPLVDMLDLVPVVVLVFFIEILSFRGLDRGGVLG
jgi:hypothetical protein